MKVSSHNSCNRHDVFISLWKETLTYKYENWYIEWWKVLKPYCASWILCIKSMLILATENMFNLPPYFCLFIFQSKASPNTLFLPSQAKKKSTQHQNKGNQNTLVYFFSKIQPVPTFRSTNTQKLKLHGIWENRPQ